MYKVYQDWGANLLGPTAALPESELPEAGCAPEAVHGAGPSPASVLVLTELTVLTELGIRYWVSVMDADQRGLCCCWMMIQDLL